ncbi:hypothetical protein MKX01_008276 [Papaver californicum]|nr:hypothetical protein MKX01_008276 [Papaver californicum]
MGKRVATVGFIEGESSPVKRYATFDYTVHKKEDEVTTSEDFSSDEEESKEQPEVVSKNVSVGTADKSSGSSESDSEEEIREIVDLKKDQGDDISDESDEEEQQRKRLKVTVDKDEEMEDSESPKTNSKAAIESKAPETPITTQIQKTASRKLFVGNLSFSLEQEDLEEFFKDAGEIVNVHFATHGDGRFKGNAIVEFATEESVQKALERNGQDLMGRLVNLALPGKSGGTGSGWKSDVDAESPKTNSKPETRTTPQVQNTGSKKLFVGNLSFSLEQKDLEEFFKDAGEIVKVHFPTLKDGRFKGHATVTFATEEAVQKAVEKNGQDLMGRCVNLVPQGNSCPSTPQTGYARGGRSGIRGGRFGIRGGRFRGVGRGGRFQFPAK